MSTDPVDADKPNLVGRDRNGDDAGPVKSHISSWLAFILRPIHRVLVWLYFRVEVVHPERIPVRGPVLIAPTHRSRWDPVVLYCMPRRFLRFMASQDEFVGLQGWIMRNLGTFPVNTKRPTPGALRHCRELILAGEALVIFPEGTLFYYPPHNVHPIKPGVAWLALDCQEQMPDAPLPIIPIRIVYSDRYPRFRTHVQILIQEPIQLGVYLALPRRAAIRQLTADLQRGLGDVVNESLAEMSRPRDAAGKAASDPQKCAPGKAADPAQSSPVAQTPSQG